jgi:hypothetical protein
MVSARALGGAISSKIFGRSDELGFRLVLEAQNHGLIPKGAGGGFGAHDATSADAALLLVALLGNPDHPRRDIRQAAACFDAAPARYAHVDYLVKEGDYGSIAAHQTAFPPLCQSFGHHLAAAIAMLRAHGHLPAPQSLMVVMSKPTRTAVLSLSTPWQRVHGDIMTCQRRAYVAGVDVSTFSPFCDVVTREFSLSMLAEIAAELGPLGRDELDTLSLSRGDDAVKMSVSMIERNWASLFVQENIDAVRSDV